MILECDKDRFVRNNGSRGQSFYSAMSNVNKVNDAINISGQQRDICSKLSVQFSLFQVSVGFPPLQWEASAF